MCDAFADTGVSRPQNDGRPTGRGPRAFRVGSNDTLATHHDCRRNSRQANGLLTMSTATSRDMAKNAATARRTGLAIVATEVVMLPLSVERIGVCTISRAGASATADFAERDPQDPRRGHGCVAPPHRICHRD